MPKREPVEEALRAAVGLLDDLHVSYALVGGLAVNFWGRARMTQDVDIAVVVQAEGVDALGQAMLERGFGRAQATPTQLGKEILYRFEWPATALPLDIHVDLLVAGSLLYESCVRDAVEARIGDTVVRVARLEDLVLVKLIVGRPVDRVDAEELGRINRESLDAGRLRRCAERVGTGALIEEYLSHIAGADSPR